MDKINKAISDNVKMGQYYIDSKNWYLRRFTYPIVERSYLTLISIIFIIIIFEIVITISMLTPTVVKLPIAMNVRDSLNNIAIIQKIPLNDLSPEEAVKKYLIKRYVTNRESYKYEDIQNQLNVVKNSSLRYIYKEFYNYLSLDNPNSPILYQKQKSRNIEIVSINFVTSNNVKVKFKSIENNNIDKTFIESLHIANISFQIGDVSDIIKSKGDKNLNFIVTEYEIDQAN